MGNFCSVLFKCLHMNIHNVFSLIDCFVQKCNINNESPFDELALSALGIFLHCYGIENNFQQKS